MKLGREELTYRRRVILVKIDAQRRQLDSISKRWQKPLTLADTGISAVNFMHNHRAFFSASVASLLTWRRKGFIGLLAEGWRLLGLYPAILGIGLEYLSLGAITPDEEPNTLKDD